MRVFLLLSVAACGRFGFGAGHDAATTDAAGDAAQVAGLVVHLPLDSISPLGSTLVTVDASGNGHDAHCDAAMGQCPSGTPGRLDGALAFDGIDDRLVIDDAPAFHSPAGFTVAAWVQFDAALAQAGCPYQKIVGGEDQNSWELCINADGSTYFFSSDSPFAGNGNALDVPTPPVAVGPWHHAAITWDGALRRKEIWLDGQPIGLSQGVALAPLFDAGPIVLGLDFDNGTENAQFRGRIDDLRIYDRTLAAAELVALAAP